MQLQLNVNRLYAPFLLIENDMKRNVEVQAVQSYPYINQNHDSYPKRKHTDCKQLLSVSYLQVVGLVDTDSILKEHSVQLNQF